MSDDTRTVAGRPLPPRRAPRPTIVPDPNATAAATTTAMAAGAETPAAPWGPADGHVRPLPAPQSSERLVAASGADALPGPTVAVDAATARGAASGSRPLPARPLPAPAAVVGASTRPVPAAGPVARQRPDVRPVRMGVGLGAFAALSVVGAGLVRFPVSSDPATVADAQADPSVAPVVQDIPVQHVVQYVQLRAGQKAPAGAKVIDAAAPTPRGVVTHVSAPVSHVSAPAPAARRVTVVRTRQSGKP
jgi:hypothetical protein